MRCGAGPVRGKRFVGFGVQGSRGSLGSSRGQLVLTREELRLGLCPRCRCLHDIVRFEPRQEPTEHLEHQDPTSCGGDRLQHDTLTVGKRHAKRYTPLAAAGDVYERESFAGKKQVSDLMHNGM